MRRWLSLGVMDVWISHPFAPSRSFEWSSTSCECISRSLCVVVEVVLLDVLDWGVAVVVYGQSHEVDLAQDMLWDPSRRIWKGSCPWRGWDLWRRRRFTDLSPVLNTRTLLFQFNIYLHYFLMKYINKLVVRDQMTLRTLVAVPSADII